MGGYDNGSLCLTLGNDLNIGVSGGALKKKKALRIDIFLQTLQNLHVFFQQHWVGMIHQPDI